MTYPTTSSPDVRTPKPQNSSSNRGRTLLKGAVGGLAVVAIGFATVTAVAIGVGWLFAAGLQARSDVRSVAALVPLSGALAASGSLHDATVMPPTLVAASPPPAVGPFVETLTRNPIGALALLVPKVLPHKSAPYQAASREAGSHEAAPHKSASREAPSQAASSYKPRPDRGHKSDDRIVTASIGPYPSKHVAPDVASVSGSRNRSTEDVSRPVPLPRMRPQLVSLTPDDGLGSKPEPYSRFRRTAIYDITAQTVYLPNGERLEAHSGLGRLMDDPLHVRQKNRGATPPNTYNLKLRESLFHGVQAIRLTPVGDGDMFGRDGILAHSYMLGPSGQSNGCVSFKDYPRFLRAYLRGEFDRMVVVSRLDKPPAFAARRNIQSASNMF
jgi:hypothetical protein